MALSLGEKLRQAREARGVTVSEVAEQTRISSLYLEGIENDDYRALPGGVFNKGFVKSFAKFVGLDEQEALADYSRLLSESMSDSTPQDARVYRPTVLTDDRARPSIIPTVIFTAIILALLSGGVMMLVKYYNEMQAREATIDSGLAGNIATNSSDSNSSNSNSSTNSSSVENASATGEMRIEFTSLSAPGEESPKVQWMVDGAAPVTDSLLPGLAKDFSPKKSLKVSYWRGFATKFAVKINGKSVSIPQVPANPRSQFIEFVVTPEKLPQILSGGAISPGVVAVPTVPAVQPRRQVSASPAPVRTPITTPTAVPRPTVNPPARTIAPANVRSR